MDANCDENYIKYSRSKREGIISKCYTTCSLLHSNTLRFICAALTALCTLYYGATNCFNMPTVKQLPLSNEKINRKLPTKSDFVTAVGKWFGSEVSSKLECTAGTELLTKPLENLGGGAYAPEVILKLYSSDHFSFESPTQCGGPLQTSRLVKFLYTHYANTGDGGSSFQCPEAAQFFEQYAMDAPDGSNICDFGFNLGGSSSIFLSGSAKVGKLNTKIHAFDMECRKPIVGLLQELYGQDRLTCHEDYISNFAQKNVLCNYIWWDIHHISAQDAVLKNPGATVVYHFGTRNADNKQIFLDHVQAKRINECWCLKLDCMLARDDPNKRIVREICLAKVGVPCGTENL